MKNVIVVLGVAIAIVVIAIIGLRIYTKSFSPEGLTQFDEDGVELQITYGRPYKKERIIFGGLVPYDEVWRTGANEPTIFTTNVDLQVGDQVLKSGKYSFFTIPGRDSWQVIFNESIPKWGVNLSGEVARTEESDVLVYEVPALKTQNSIEQFTINFEEMHDELDMVMMWDETLVVVPMKPVN